MAIKAGMLQTLDEVLIHAFPSVDEAIRERLLRTWVLVADALQGKTKPEPQRHQYMISST